MNTQSENDGVLNYQLFLDWYADYEHDFLYDWDKETTTIFKQWLKHPWFKYLVELFDYQSKDEFFIENFGITIRNGKPIIVVLDMGWE